MRPAQQFQSFVPVSEVFPDTDNSFRTFITILSGLSLTDTLLWCARINQRLFNGTIDSSAFSDTQIQLLGFFLNEQDFSRLAHFSSKHGGITNVKAFSRYQLLEVMRWALLFCDDLPDDGNTYTSQEVRRSFMKVALIAHDIWNAQIFGPQALEGRSIDDFTEYLGAFRKSMEAVKTAPSFWVAIGRGYSLFSDYLPRKYSNFEVLFTEVTGLTIMEHYAILLAFISNFDLGLHPDKTGIIEISQLPSADNIARRYSSKLTRFLANETQTIDELRSALWGNKSRISLNSYHDASRLDEQCIRSRPILRTDDGRGIIIDPVYFAERASVGPLFSLLPEVKDGDLLLNQFGEAFEEYCCEILNDMFPDVPDASPKRLECQVPIGPYMIDACLNDFDQAVLFETKAVWLREEEIRPNNPQDFIEHLREKYVVGKSGRRKGIGQLAQQIIAIDSDESDARFSNIELVYPILIAHDYRLGMPLIGRFFAREFVQFWSRQLPESDRLSLERLIVCLPIVLTIDDLESLQILTKKTSFMNLISSYSLNNPDRQLSFHNHLTNAEYWKDTNQVSSLTEITESIFEKAREIFA